MRRLDVTYALYPQPAARALSILHAAPRVDTRIEQLAGPPPEEFGHEFTQVMFIRLALLTGTGAPTLSLRADAGAIVTLTHDQQAVFAQPGQDGHIGSAWMVESASTFDIFVGFTTAAIHTWTLGITNNDTTTGQHYTWVVADNPREIAQPWNNPSPFRYTLTNQIPLPLAQFPHVAVDSGTHTAYAVSSNGSTEIWAIDNGQISAHVTGLPVDTHRLAVDSRTHSVWITEPGVNHVVAINKGLAVIGDVPLGPANQGDGDAVAVDAAARSVYVAGSPSNAVTVIDADQHVLRSTIPVGKGPHHIAVAPDSSAVYVSNSSERTVTVIRAGGVDRTVGVGNRPTAIAIGPGHRSVYVCNEDDATISIIDVATMTVSTLTVPLDKAGKPRAVTVDADRYILYVAVIGGTAPNRRLYAIDTRTEVFSDAGIEIFANPMLALDATDGTVYLACQRSVDAFVGIYVFKPATA